MCSQRGLAGREQVLPETFVWLLVVAVLNHVEFTCKNIENHVLFEMQPFFPARRCDFKVAHCFNQLCCILALLIFRGEFQLDREVGQRTPHVLGAVAKKSCVFNFLEYEHMMVIPPVRGGYILVIKSLICDMFFRNMSRKGSPIVQSLPNPPKSNIDTEN